MVNRALFAGSRATGIEIVERGQSKQETAADIILCGGAINSPQLLQLLGVGNARELEAVGVKPLHQIPGVGENLQDHLEVYVQYASKLPVSVAPAMKRRNRPKVGAEWAAATQRHGSDQPLRGRRLRALERGCGLPQPDVPLPADRHPLARRPRATRSMSGASDARGSVKIVSTDPRRHLALRFNYLSTEQDRRLFYVARKVLTQRRLTPTTTARSHPGPRLRPTNSILDGGARCRDRAASSCT